MSGVFGLITHHTKRDTYRALYAIKLIPHILHEFLAQDTINFSHQQYPTAPDSECQFHITNYVISLQSATLTSHSNDSAPRETEAKELFSRKGISQTSQAGVEGISFEGFLNDNGRKQIVPYFGSLFSQ